MAVTITDIANASGYSRGTVDRALNNKGRINAETRDKILRIANEMGYRPCFIARSLSRGVTMTIGVVVFDIENRYFALLLNAIEKVAKANNYSVIIMLQEKDKNLEIEVINKLVDRKVDGIILCPVNKDSGFIDIVKKLPMPVITIGNQLSDGIQNVGIDEKEATVKGTELIVSKGYKKIVFVCPYLEDGKEENIYAHEQRKFGFIHASTKFPGVEFELLDNRKAIEDIQTRIDPRKPTAFFCSGDMLALNIIKALRKKDITAPQNYGIMGFDGLDILDYVTPSLATIQKPIKELGEKAFEDLLKLIEGKQDISDDKINYIVVEGETIRV